MTTDTLPLVPRVPSFVTKGARVWYSPGPDLWFAGTVDNEPWELGDGSLVVHLRDMATAYSAWLGRERTRVASAFVDRLRPYNPEAVRRVASTGGES